MNFRSFRTRILVFFLGLMVLVQTAVFFAVNRANINNAREAIDEALIVATSVFQRQLESRSHELLLAARLLSSDYAFKAAYATSEHPTVLSALDNHRERISADIMMLLSMDGTVLADTLRPELTAADNPYPEIVTAAEKSDFGEASGVTLIDGRPYQIVLVPLFMPTPAAWVCIGFAIGDDLARDLQEATLTHVSFVQGDAAGGWIAFASTLPGRLRNTLQQTLAEASWQPDESSTLDMHEDMYVSLVTPLAGGTRHDIVAVLQRSLSKALAPYMRLRVVLFGLFSVGILLSVAGAFLIARSVTQPVSKLAEGARRIQQGDYSKTVTITQKDEIGMLGSSFNHMLRGLVERDRVRNLLGKVVSPAIAEELLAREIELGGEEREVSILFTDLRDFTSLCEDRSPQDILALLNAYLTRVSSVVEANGGVVDKYVGDCTMAIYGAPLDQPNHAERAINTALGIYMATREFNAEASQNDWPQVSAGAGVNSARVVAGNMGSTTRLNYTVIGDGVNLASRLEALTKYYGVNVIVSDASKKQAPGFLFRELDCVRVKGKHEAVTIHEPLCRLDSAEQNTIDELKSYDVALSNYRRQDWDLAHADFLRLRSSAPHNRLYQIYLERLAGFRLNPPSAGWDGTYVWQKK